VGRLEKKRGAFGYRWCDKKLNPNNHFSTRRFEKNLLAFLRKKKGYES
jgi:hypothetical protein